MHQISNPPKNDWSKILERPTLSNHNTADIVASIFDLVEKIGDKALKQFTEFYDSVSVDSFCVSEKTINDAEIFLANDLKKAILLAKSNIQKFHDAQKTNKISVETISGVQCWQEKRAIQKVGLYIPGGTAPLFSTVLMLAIPAQIAGCSDIVLCTPPDKSGSINPAVLYAAKICGVTQIYTVGGIQAIAAMTLGTETIPKVYKIFGPGNQYVTAAKQYATQLGVAIDMPAGPSELMVVADDSANAAFVAADLLSQAEHGTDSQVILVSNSQSILNAVSSEIKTQIESLPRRHIAKQSIKNSKLLLIENDEMILEIINEYAPEHLIICMKNEDYFLDHIQNAGSIFIGNYTPESAGDYASGTNHTLPTNGFARNYSGVNLDSFLKTISFQKISKQGIQNIGKAVEIMADAEGLQGHSNAISVRLQYLEQNHAIK